MKYYGGVDTIQKLRLENATHLRHDIVLHPPVILLLIVRDSKAETLRLHDGRGTCIGCHNENRIFKIDLAALGIGNVTVV